MNAFKPRGIGYLILAIVLVLLFNLQPIVAWLEQLELRSLDARQLTIQENRFKSNISLVELDDTITARELYAIFDRYPFKLEVYGYLNRFLSRGNAKNIIYDVNFTSAPDTCHPQSDQFFVNSIHETPLTLSALDVYGKENHHQDYYTDQDATGFILALGPEWLKKPVPQYFGTSTFSGIRPAILPLLASPMRFYPSSSLGYDRLGKARRSILFSTYWQKIFLPNLAPAALMERFQDFEVSANGKLRFGPYWVDTHGETTPIIRWYGNISDTHHPVYPRYSFWPVIKSQLWWECQQNKNETFCNKLDFKGFKPIDPAVFKDQRVWIGMTSSYYEADTHASLYDEGKLSGKYPGVYIQANIMDNLMHDDFVRRPGWRFTLPTPGQTKPSEAPVSYSFVTLLTVLGMMGATCYSSLRWRSVPLSIVSVLALGVVYTQGCLWAYQHMNLWLNWIYPITGLLITFTATYVYRYFTTERRKNQLRYAFQKYVSPAVMAVIEKNPTQVKLGGHRREMTMLFCDIRGFTTFSESHAPEDVQELLSEYFSVMNDIILNQYGGSINKLIGDAIMAYWGFPLENEDHAFLAVSAALKMQDAIQIWRHNGENLPLHIGIGINTGDAVIGNVGSKDFMDFTVIGDAVNVASRLEGVNKTFNTTIIISAATCEKIKDRIEVRSLGSVPLKGKDQEVEIYEPIGFLE